MKKENDLNNDKSIKLYFSGISDEQSAKIWEVWAGDWHHNYSGDFDCVWLGYDELSEKTEIKIAILKRFMKAVRDFGLAYFSPTINCEGHPNGSGTFLFDRYQDLSWEQMKEIMNNGC